MNSGSSGSLGWLAGSHRLPRDTPRFALLSDDTPHRFPRGELFLSFRCVTGADAGGMVPVPKAKVMDEE